MAPCRVIVYSRKTTTRSMTAPWSVPQTGSNAELGSEKAMITPLRTQSSPKD